MVIGGVEGGKGEKVRAMVDEVGVGEVLEGVGEEEKLKVVVWGEVRGRVWLDVRDVGWKEGVESVVKRGGVIRGEEGKIV